jgi:type IV secretion system protein VirB1
MPTRILITEARRKAGNFIMEYAHFENYAKQCAPAVHPRTMAYVVAIESSFNPFAIAVIGGRLERQPRNLEEAVATAKFLDQNGIKYSAGISQIFVKNFTKRNLDTTTVFDICENLRAGAEILSDCFDRAKAKTPQSDQHALEKALSCYESNNFVTGFNDGYVQKIVNHAYKQRLKNLAR